MEGVFELVSFEEDLSLRCSRKEKRGRSSLQPFLTKKSKRDKIRRKRSSSAPLRGARIKLFEV